MTALSIISIIILVISGVSSLFCLIGLGSEWDNYETFSTFWWSSTISVFIFGLFLFLTVQDVNYDRIIKSETPITLETLDVDGVSNQFVCINGSLFNITHRTKAFYKEGTKAFLREYELTPYKLCTRPSFYVVIDDVEVFGFSYATVLIEGEGNGS